MPISIADIPDQELHLSSILRVDGTTPHLSRWLEERGPLSSSMLAQLAETGLRAGYGTYPAQVLVRPLSPPQSVKGKKQAVGTRLRARLVLHPLCHPSLISHLQALPAELHRRSVLYAIEAGLQWVIHVWKSGGSVGMPTATAFLANPPADAAALMDPKHPETPIVPTPISAMPDVPKEPELLAPSISHPASAAPASQQPDGLLDLGSLSTLLPSYD